MPKGVRRRRETCDRCGKGGFRTGGMLMGTITSRTPATAVTHIYTFRNTGSGHALFICAFCVRELEYGREAEA